MWSQRLLTDMACKAAGIGSEASARDLCSSVLTDTTCLCSAADTATFMPCTCRSSLLVLVVTAFKACNQDGFWSSEDAAVPHDLAVVLLLPESERTARQILSLRPIRVWLRQSLPLQGVGDFRGHLCPACRSEM